MKVEDLYGYQSVNITVPISLIEDNPHRNLNLNKLNQSKVNELIESYEKTGYWNNTMCRPKDNKIPALGDDFTEQQFLEYMASFNGNPIDFIVQMSYGRHRIEALRQMKESIKHKSIENIRMEMKFMSNEKMLQVQVHENRSEWGHGMATGIESISQVHDTIKAQLDEFALDEFDDYKEKYPYGYFATSKSFADAKGAKGIGFDTIQKFLGGKWKENDVYGPLNAIKASREGLFDIKNCYNISNSSVLREIVALIKDINEEIKFPAYFKPLWTQEIFDTVDTKKNPNKTVTVSDVKKARRNFKQGFNPINGLKGNIAKPFKVEKLIEEELQIKGINTIDEAIALGFEGWEEEVSKAVANIVDRAEKAQKKLDKTDGKEDEKVDDSDLNNLAGSDISGSDDMSDLSKPPTIDYAIVSDNFSSAGNALLMEARKLQQNANKIPKENSAFFTKLEETIGTLASLYQEIYGPERLAEIPNLALAYSPKKTAKEIIEESDVDPDATDSELMQSVIDEVPDDADEENDTTEAPVDPPMAERAKKKMAGKKSMVKKTKK